MMKTITIIISCAVLSSIFSAACFAEFYPAENQSILCCNISAGQAYEKWKADPGKVHIVDCRTPGEYIFVGHAPMAWNIPLKFLGQECMPGKSMPEMPLNEDFLSLVKERFKPDDIILIMCMSGGRSSYAANLLVQSGFSNVFNIADGFEGDKLQVPDSYNLHASSDQPS